jgi:hypothetical protein
MPKNEKYPVLANGINPELFQHIDNSPSIFFNSILARVLLFVFYTLGSILFVLGFVFLVESYAQSNLFSADLSEKVYELFRIPKDAQESIENLLFFLGIVCTSIGLLFLLIARLTRMLLKRNRHIWQTWLIKTDLEEAAEKKANDPFQVNAWAFVQDEIWNLIFGGAFQRSGVYESNLPDNTMVEKEKLAFRQFIRGKVEEIGHFYWSNEVSNDQHIRNVWRLCEQSAEFGKENQSLLKNNRINFGIAQKLLNLYLKYHWTMGHLQITPPHFPMDRIIQERLNEERKKAGLSTFKIEAWTQFKDEEDYCRVIEAAKELLGKREEKSLAELELVLFGK